MTNVKEGFAWKYNDCNSRDDSYCMCPMFHEERVEIRED